jgi:hypothetical protein
MRVEEVPENMGVSVRSYPCFRVLLFVILCEMRKCNEMGINHYCPTYRLRLELSHVKFTRSHTSC